MKNWNFTIKILSCFLCVVLLTLIISTAMIVPRVRSIVQSNYQNTMELTMDLLNQNVKNVLDYYERMAYSIISSDELNRWLLVPPSPGDRLNRQKTISDFFSTNIIGDRYIRSIAVKCYDGRVYSHSRYNESGINEIIALDPMQYPSSKNGGFTWLYSPPTPDFTDPTAQEGHVTLLGVVKNRSDVYKNEIIATFAVEFEINMIRDLYSNASMNGNGQIRIINQEGFLFPAEKKQNVISEVSTEILDFIKLGTIQSAELKKQLVSIRQIKRTDWNLVGILDKERIYREISTIELGLYFIIIFAFVVAVLLSMGLAFGITKPIKQLMKYMKKVEKGDFSIQIPVERQDEFGRLSMCFNQMVSQVENLVHEVYEVKTSEKEAQISAMKAQMNPHFLYNSLDAINWAINFGENEKASDMIHSLTGILRYSISSNEFTTLRSEIEQVSNYLFIQENRLGEKLKHRIEIEEEILDCKVMKFFIQPLVENAIIHGLAECGHQGEVIIYGRLINEDLQLEIRDNGVGIDPQKLQNILDGKEKESEGHTGIGISNVIKRIKLVYGEERYGVWISSDTSGTRVVITLPIRF